MSEPRFTAGAKAGLLRGSSLVDELGESALLPGRCVAMNQVLPPGAVDQRDGGGIRLGGFALRGGADLPDGAAELAALGAVPGRGGGGLTHALLGGLDSRHGFLEVLEFADSGTDAKDHSKASRETYTSGPLRSSA